jgi:hypothetical protein
MTNLEEMARYIADRKVDTDNYLPNFPFQSVQGLATYIHLRGKELLGTDYTAIVKTRFNLSDYRIAVLHRAGEISKEYEKQGITHVNWKNLESRFLSMSPKKRSQVFGLYRVAIDPGDFKKFPPAPKQFRQGKFYIQRMLIHLPRGHLEVLHHASKRTL